MLARTSVVWSHSSHRRMGILGSSSAVWREYVSLSSCGKCEFLRSERSSRKMLRNAFLKRKYSASTSQVSIANPHKTLERWREKQDGRVGQSQESVHTEMIEVLTYKMERMIKDESQSYLPLTIHSANAQSVSEEQWTDFDAMSVMTSGHVTLKPLRVGSENHRALSDWNIELLQFKNSILKEARNSSTRTSKNLLNTVSSEAVDHLTRTKSAGSSHQKTLSSLSLYEKHSKPNIKSHQNKLSERNSESMDFGKHKPSLRPESLDILQGKQIPLTRGSLLSKVSTDTASTSSAIQNNVSSNDLPGPVQKNEISGKGVSLIQSDGQHTQESTEIINEQMRIESIESRVSWPAEYSNIESVTEEPELEAFSESLDREYHTEVDQEGSEMERELDTASVKSAPPVFLSKKKKARLAKETAKQKAAAHQTKKPAQVKPIDVEKKITYFNQDLLSYVEACVQAGMVSTAQQTVNFYRYNGNRQKQKSLENKDFDVSHLKIRNVQIYNVLMHSWAKQEELDMIKQCFSHISEDGLAPDLQSYAACLECLGRHKCPDLNILERVVADIEKDGLDIKDLFNKCIFARDERQVIYQAIRQVLPDYEPAPPPDVRLYDNTLLESLSQLSPEQVAEKNPYQGVLTGEELKTRAAEQMQLEIADDVMVKSVVRRSEPSERTLKMRKVLEEIKNDWRTMIKKGLERKMKYMHRRNKGEHGMNLYPYLKLFDIGEYVELIMKEIHLLCTESEHFSPYSGYLWRRLGYRAYQKSLIHQKVKNKITNKTESLYQTYSDHYASEDLGADNHRECWQMLSDRAPDGPTLDLPEKTWPYHIVKGLGKMLYDVVLYDVKFDANILKTTDTRKKIPSFYSIYRNYGHTTKEEVKPHPTLIKIYQGAELEDLTFNTKELPMLVPPLPWISAQSGGYLLSSAQLVRLPDQAQGQKNLMNKTSPEQLYPVLDALNTLSACAWKINKPMLDLIIHIFNNKGNKELDIPPPVSEAPPIPRLSKNMTSQERSKVYGERLKVKQQRSEMYSLWCNELYRLSIANKFREEIFWFPHNLDFRGRTYPCPPHFNHLGSDVTRSILYFAKGKPLGEKGLDWLKIHLVNLTGLKKRSPNTERLEFANSMMPSILDSADNPLTGEKWWQSSDEPWQTLACCMEIAQAVRSPDPSQFVSHFPVHQDGSCNGLQHYAALGRDQAGAESVNLHPFDEPKDVYSDVALLVERERLKDAAEGSEVARVLEGFVRRKVIKQTVMTTVYGVTRYGAKYQILRQLKDIPEFPDEFAWQASMYLTEKTFFCLQEMFSATKEIQDWLTVSAHLIATVCSKPVEWITPLGFPIIQPYHKSVTSTRSGVRVTDTTSLFQKPNSMKQKNAFPPNFIHSLDSTHMMLTAIYCLKAGITYVSVHDCFWTHPCDVEIMNKITREQFVSLHEQPILEDLSAYLAEKFGSSAVDANLQNKESQDFLNNILSRVPKKGEFDLNNVLKSTYFFS